MLPRILIVDDEKGFTDILKLTLEATGKYQVQVENNPQHAVKMALQYRPHLILLDVIMPRMEGPDVAIEMRNDEKLKEIPIIFLTGTITEDEALEVGHKIGKHTFVSKPCHLEDLLNAIEEYILPFSD